ncbi:Uncharacterized protein APZ42_027240 [Daphnia magna]|uniref:Uncharacterized protein n=1 Tax=Daphnia magna TaxID=35525 RepID=A0A164RDH0_9CRUS|nr:Uncharacterized protein APZ42_027240 [Daphnia magna]
MYSLCIPCYAGAKRGPYNNHSIERGKMFATSKSFPFPLVNKNH